MSRESDSSSSGPQGRGGAAYPSGTPPYGSPRGEAGDTPASGAAAQPEEPKTETTLTTRIKINIPGSRPIPPVVVRKPVGEEAGMNGSAGSGGSAGTRGTPRPAERNAERTANTPRPDAPADEAPAGGPPEKTSDWFAPRKPQGGAGASSSTGSHAVPPTPGGATPPPAPGGATPPRAPSGGTPPQRPDLPYFSDSPAAQEGASPFDGGARPGTGSPFDGGPGAAASPFDGAAPGGGTPFDDPAAPARDHSPFDAPAGGPSGPTTGPARGNAALNLPPGFSDPGTGGTPRIDDTAELTPQPPAPLAGPGSGLGGGVTGGLPTAPKGKRGPKAPQSGGPGGAPGGRGRVSGDTLVSGIPKIPGDEKPSSPSPFAQAPAGEGDNAAPKPRPKIPEPINPPKKGRNKLVLVGVGVVVLAGVAYGAGLLLDHADVPNGTTVLGVDIGGTTKEEAVKKLETALKDSRTAPLKLTVDGKPATLRPTTAGLDIDPQATVRRAAGRDYNPVSVIGSLVGVHRTAEPAVIVDDEKLQIALQNATGPGGATEDGGITFENGKAVPHYGAPHKAIDVDASKKKVTDAYRKRAATGTDAPVVLAAGTQQPQVSKAAVDKALKQFAEPAMSGLVTVRTDTAHTVSFSPQKSIPKFLSFKIINGALVPYYDRPALKQLYGDTFNGVMVTKGDGSKHPVSVEEVASAVGKALQGTSPTERVQTIATNGN
ncbi:hypothetical protein OG775_14885 [Streptomyces platensis]|uniref:hypothetical protein n=1 Tax=Streptomyces platensis TaxID=58346 RepID=UPI002256EDBC|nr:hypothetical protein [Streptomyces platensis]MCX4636398.1 hypothetical protein [Streptomyces platensis]